MKRSRILLGLIGLLALGAIAGELEARRGGGGGRGGRGGGGRMGGRRGGGGGGPRRGGGRFASRGPRGRHHHHHGYRGRYRGRRGPWRRGYGWGPYWGGGYGWWPGVTIGVGSAATDYAPSDYRDDMGYNYWEVSNSTAYPIRVRASGTPDFILIYPGSSAQVPRNASFSLRVMQDGTPQRMRFNTRSHYVEISQRGNGRLEYNSWND